MKTFKKFIKEASGFPTGPVGENPKNLAGEVTDTLGSDVFNEKNLKRINGMQKQLKVLQIKVLMLLQKKIQEYWLHNVNVL